ncbi:MAG: DUF4922 domain-containing protein, partial [Candidatus Marsarchaeota archaeon]|nr:DUF4922 domain-containing protein [Candidatus Marsarchaeota archaeon]
MKCVFCNKDNEKRQGIIYEDSKCIVTMNKYPIVRGHVLVVSKKHYTNLLDTDDDVVRQMFVVTKMVSIKMKKKLKPIGMKVITNMGRPHIPHFHIHIVPFYTMEEFMHDDYVD